MLKFIGIAAACVAALIVVILAYAATRPDTFRVARSIVVNAPADAIFPLINDYRRWPTWSPYEAKDPQMKRTYGSTTSGKGATYAWEGDSNVGAGNMAITNSLPPSKVQIKLNMLKPFEAHNDVTFMIEPNGDASRVTWDMQGPVPYFAKVVHVFFNVDKMVGSDFEAGLANLKRVAEAR